MYGQKEIVSCMIIVTLVAILNFYKSIIKRDKEIQNARRSSLFEKQKLEQLILEVEHTALKQRILTEKMLEYNDRCYDIHALIYRPKDYDNNDELEKDLKFELNGNGPGTDFSKNEVTDMNKNHYNNQVHGDIDSKSDVLIKGKQLKNEKVIEKTDTSSIVYVLVAILLGSLIKAALDLTKHYKKKVNNETENDILRRCSLQEYSLLKHKQKKQSKALEPFLKKSISSQRSLDSGSKVTLQQYDKFMRRMSGNGCNPQDYSNGSGITTEPGTPVKPGKLLAGRPAPLLRRCSVPVFALNQQAGQSRRPSMDSFSEDDSGIDRVDTKRRVRMIHRH